MQSTAQGVCCGQHAVDCKRDTDDEQVALEPFPARETMRPMVKHPRRSRRERILPARGGASGVRGDPIAVQLRRLNTRKPAAMACHITTWSGSREGRTARLTTKSQRAIAEVAQAATPRSQARPGSIGGVRHGSPETGDCRTDRAPLCTHKEGRRVEGSERSQGLSKGPQESGRITAPQGNSPAPATGRLRRGRAGSSR